MSSKSTNNQGRRTPLTLSQSKIPSSLQQQMHKRPTTANKTESTSQREQETRSKQQQQQQQHQQQHQQQQQQQKQHHLRKEEEKKEAAAIAASAAGPVPAVIIANTENKEQQQQQAAVALNNGYNKNETKNGTVINAATNGNQSSANTAQVNEVKQDRETRQNTTNKQAKEQDQQQQQQNNNVAASPTTKSANDVHTNTVQRKQQQLQAAELKMSPSSNAKKPVEEKIESKQQATMAVAEKPETSNKAKQQTAGQPEKVTNSSPAKKTPAQQQIPSSNKKEQQQETQMQAEVLEKPIVSITITEVQPAKIATTESSATIAPKTPPVKKYTLTTCIDLTEMDVSPQKASSHIKVATVAVADNPNATSTPDKYLKTGWLQGFNTPEHAKSVPMRNLAISGRRSIHREWSEYENNANFRGSYRRIKTDLDSTADTNTSLNVTIGSERGNSSWFSFSSRKRERTPNNVEGIKEELMSPPKRARFESLFSIMASPLTALRSRFAKTTIHANSSPIKSIIEEQEEKNVSMQEQESIQEVEDLTPLDVIESKKNTSSQELNKEAENAEEKLSENATTAKEAKENDIVDLIGSDDDADIEILEATDSSNTVAHKKRCDIM